MNVTVVLNDMDRSEQASYGFRSWLLQDMDEPYEVVVNLFNDREAFFRKLSEDANPFCHSRICIYTPPAFFNIAAANNLGLHLARGKYVLFANSDIVYPSDFLRRLLGEMIRRGLHYMLGARVNLNADQTRSLRPAASYSLSHSFDVLKGAENLPGRVLSIGASPWVITREAAYAIGGFDPQVICHEDSDFNDRAMHYLRRQGRQDVLYAASDLYGYHLHHAPSELYAASLQAKQILEPRRLRLLADPFSVEDIVPTSLDSIDSLKQDMYGTRPPMLAASRQARKPLYELARRVRAASKTLLRG